VLDTGLRDLEPTIAATALLMRRPCRLFILAATLVLMPYSLARTEEPRAYVVQGSTTFFHRVMEPYRAAIEASSGQKLTVVPSKSSHGLLTLFERHSDFAMISGPLQNEINELKSSNPELPYDRLQSFNIANTRMAFAVNAGNPIREISDDKMRRILLGEITNWRAVGGPDLPIRIVMVQQGGGVEASIEGEFLGGKKIAAANPLIVQVGAQVGKMTELMPEALGLAQLSIVRNSSAVELKTEHPIEQHLALVTLGDPTPEMHKVIEAARAIMKQASD
jgi:phosphate transport system substrate-binding protein